MPGQTWENTYWRGVKTAKFPTDLWIYQEILHERRPDLIVETGTYCGGSALFLADVCDALGHGRVISIDIKHKPEFPEHDRISYITGSSTHPAIAATVRKEAEGMERVMVILDSDHAEKHVARELEMYHPLVTVGDYLVVEDTNVGPHNPFRGITSGALQAVIPFCTDHQEFEADRCREKFMLTANPLGYLRRV
jgi:cephalosporin hydroxylase